jgi:dienelactone hydrolase
MKTIKSLLLLAALVGSGETHAWAKTQPDPAPAKATEHRVYGRWRGLIFGAGKPTEITIAVTEMPDGRRSALLDVPTQRLIRVPLTVKVTTATDSVYFSATRPALRFAGRWATPDSLVGSWTQGSTAATLRLEHMPGPEAARRSAPPYLIEEVRFVNTASSLEVVASAGGADQNGLALVGTLTRPTGKGPFPALLLLSDLGLQNRDAVYDDYRLFAELANYFTLAGFVVLRYDDRGVGQSAGDLLNSTVADLATDAHAGLEFLRARPDVDVNRIGLLGHGQGANVALLAATGGLPPSFVVAMAAYGVPGHEALVQQHITMMQGAGADPTQVAAGARRQRDMLTIIRHMTDKTQTQAIVANMLRQDSPGIDQAAAQTSAAQLLTRSYRAFLDFNPQSYLSQVRCPVLLLGGSADEQVDADLNLGTLQKGLFGSRGVTVLKLPGVNHLLQPNMQQWPIVGGQPRAVPAPAALDGMANWLRRQTSAKAAAVKQPVAKPAK